MNTTILLILRLIAFASGRLIKMDNIYTIYIPRLTNQIKNRLYKIGTDTHELETQSKIHCKYNNYVTIHMNIRAHKREIN